MHKHFEGGLTNHQPDRFGGKTSWREKQRVFVIILLQVQDGAVLLRVMAKLWLRS